MRGALLPHRLFAHLRSSGGAALPTDRIIDGADLTEVLLRGGGEGRAEFRYYRFETLERCAGASTSCTCSKRLAPCRELYDLAADLGETTNLYAERPGIVAELMRAVNDARQDLGCAGAGVTGQGNRQPGRVAPPQKLTGNFDPDHPYIIALYDKEEDFRVPLVFRAPRGRDR